MNAEGGQSLYRANYFRVGIAADPQESDPYCDTEEQAIERAQRMADAHGYRTAVAVWDSRGDTLYLFMLGEQFRKV